jgi:hypothetical protein
MKLPEWLRDKLRTALVAGLVGLFAFFGAKIYHAVAGPLLAHVFPAIPNTLLVSLCSILMLTVCLLVWWVIYLHRLHREPTEAERQKALDAQFEDKLDPLGVWKHRTKEGYFCPTCKMSGRESQLITGEINWFCPVQDCRFAIANPKTYGSGRQPLAGL